MNCLAYNWKINELLIANILLNFSEFYNPYITIRRVTLQAFSCRFVRMVFEKRIEVDFIDDFMYFKRSKRIPTNSFNNYYYRGLKFVIYFFNDY